MSQRDEKEIDAEVSAPRAAAPKRLGEHVLVGSPSTNKAASARMPVSGGTYRDTSVDRPAMAYQRLVPLWFPPAPRWPVLLGVSRP